MSTIRVWDTTLQIGLHLVSEDQDNLGTFHAYYSGDTEYVTTADKGEEMRVDLQKSGDGWKFVQSGTSKVVYRDNDWLLLGESADSDAYTWDFEFKRNVHYFMKQRSSGRYVCRDSDGDLNFKNNGVWALFHRFDVYPAISG